MDHLLIRPELTRSDLPPAPDAVSTLNELSSRLRDLRAWAGNPSFTRMVAEIAAVRAARGVPVENRRPGRVTVYECFQLGRKRIDVELLVDIVAALGVDGTGQARWRRAHRVASGPRPTPVAVADIRPDSQARAVAALLTAIGTSGRRVVNVVGPVGIGKSRVLSALPVEAVMVDLADSEAALDTAVLDAREFVLVDNADAPAALDAVCAAVERHHDVRFVVATRRPLSGRPQTPIALLNELAVVPVPPWEDTEVDALAYWAGLDGQHQRAAVVRMAVGVPLLADRLCRAIHRGVQLDTPGALADLAVEEVIARLRRERPHADDLTSLTTLASCGQADEELLTPAGFADLAEISLVCADTEGLRLREPYRTLFDSVHRWRRPLSHRRSVARAMAHHRAVRTDSVDPDQCSRRTEQALWLTGNPTIRETLFPSGEQPVVVRSSADSDADDIGRLVHRWARRGEMDVRSSERVLNPLLADTPDGFRIATDQDGRILGAITSIPIASRNHHLVEPLLEGHTPGVTDQGGLLVGMSIARDNAAQAALMRDVLVRGVRAGLVVVATQWPAYQRLVRRLHFTYLGTTRADVFRCGRQVQVHTLRLVPDEIAQWVSRLSRRRTPLGDLGRRARLVDQLRHAYEHWHTPSLLSTSPLLAHPATPTVSALRAVLSEVAQRFAADADPVRATGGRALLDAYLSRAGAVRHDAGTAHPRPGAAVLGQAITDVAEFLWPAQR